MHRILSSIDTDLVNKSDVTLIFCCTCVFSRIVQALGEGYVTLFFCCGFDFLDLVSLLK